MLRQLIVGLSCLAQLAHSPVAVSGRHLFLLVHIPRAASGAQYPGHDFQTSNKSISCQLICCLSRPHLPTFGPRSVACRRAKQLSPLRFALTVSPCRLLFFPHPSGTNAKPVKRKSCFSPSDRPCTAMRFQQVILAGSTCVRDAGLLFCQRLQLISALLFSLSTTVAFHIVNLMPEPPYLHT